MQGQITTSLATVLLLGSLAASSLAGGAGPMTSAAAQEPDPFVGEQMCARCHAEINEALTDVSHGSGAGEMLAEAGCQSCHGPGRRHVQRPNDTDLTPSVERMTRAEQAELCTSCHSATRRLSTRPTRWPRCHARGATSFMRRGLTWE